MCACLYVICEEDALSAFQGLEVPVHSVAF